PDPTATTVPAEGATTTVAPTTTAPPTTTTQPSRRAITPAEPLDLFIAGDSMMQELGNGLLRIIPADLVDAELDYRVSTGLSRPDFFDWPQRLAEVVTQDPPEASVVFFGTNDNQNLSVDGNILQRGSAEWEAEYRSRVATVMDLLTQPGGTLTWVGLPVMRDQTLEQGVQIMNRVYAEEAAKRPLVTFVDTHALFSDANGQFAEYLPAADGSSAKMRQGDGIHLSIAGADRMANAAWATLASTWNLA
ncbi:MAG: DUF459 domain-containing protein, partial [Actinomycetota bacterium]|nr:DUF459 domain-containing protein [Actinomycetota bacterium]